MTASTAAQRPIADGLFTWPAEDPRLIGGMCGTCGVVTFPQQARCPRCQSQDMTELLLSTTGTLWTFTTQDFPLKWPYKGPVRGEFERYGVGYVELAEGLCVEACLTESDPRILAIGLSMRLVFVPVFLDPDGTEVVSFAFAPTSTTGSA